MKLAELNIRDEIDKGADMEVGMDLLDDVSNDPNSRDNSAMIARIKQAIKASHYTEHKALAADLKISRQALSMWLNGKVIYIKPVHLVRLAELLNVDVRWILTGEGDKDDKVAQSVITNLKSLGERDRQSILNLIESLAYTKMLAQKLTSALT